MGHLKWYFSIYSIARQRRLKETLGDLRRLKATLGDLRSQRRPSFTQEYQKHEPSGYCLYLKRCINDKYKPIVYIKKSEDDNISEKFIKHLKILTHSIYRKYYLNPKPLKLTPEEEKDFKSAKVCHVFEQEFGVYEKTGEIFKVRDHCHFTGKYRGAVISNVENHLFFQWYFAIFKVMIHIFP